ncbi:MAG: peptidoglycan-binding protein LysM [Litorimonas sp.]
MFGMIPFVKAAGKGLGKIFGGDKKEAEERLKKEVKTYDLDTDGVDIHVDDDGVVTVKGEAVSQEMKEKIILAVGNVEGVGGVNDETSTRLQGRASRFHTVESGDTLSAISKTYYGTWKLYPEIFEANKPMLSDPDKIYPGQVLRIPDLKTASA